MNVFGKSWFDLVITDLLMIGNTGIELSREIKQRDDICGVFILTGQATMDLAIEALRAGADDFLLKPCDIKELLLRMGKYFEKQDAMRKLIIYEEFLPICMYCKKIRDDSDTDHGGGQWLRLEEYFNRRDKVSFTHGCCPDCFKKNHKDWLGDAETQHPAGSAMAKAR